MTESTGRHECPKCKHVWWGVSLKTCPGCNRTIKESLDTSMRSPTVMHLMEMEAHDTLMASDLGWKPGEWPKVLKHEGNEYGRTGEVSRDREGDIQYVVYAWSDFYNKSRVGQKPKIHVYND